MADRTLQVLNAHVEGLNGPKIADGVASLVSWSLNGGLWPRRSLVVRDSSVGFQSMAEWKRKYSLLAV